MNPARRTSPDLQTLVGLFYKAPEDLGDFEEVEASALPAPYAELLAHQQHMTVTVEEFHNSPVEVKVLETNITPTHYARKILLTRKSDGNVAQFGIVRICFDYLEPEVRREIESQTSPLGRILIEHNVLRQVQLSSLWKITIGVDLRHLFGLDSDPPENIPVTYGRTALIYCNGEPAIELLEVVTPV